MAFLCCDGVCSFHENSLSIRFRPGVSFCMTAGMLPTHPAVFSSDFRSQRESYLSLEAFDTHECWLTSLLWGVAAATLWAALRRLLWWSSVLQSEQFGSDLTTLLIVSNVSVRYFIGNAALYFLSFGTLRFWRLTYVTIACWVWLMFLLHYHTVGGCISIETFSY